MEFVRATVRFMDATLDIMFAATTNAFRPKRGVQSAQSFRTVLSVIIAAMDSANPDSVKSVSRAMCPKCAATAVFRVSGAKYVHVRMMRNADSITSVTAVNPFVCPENRWAEAVHAMSSASPGHATMMHVSSRVLRMRIVIPILTVLQGSVDMALAHENMSWVNSASGMETANPTIVLGINVRSMPMNRFVFCVLRFGF